MLQSVKREFEAPQAVALMGVGTRQVNHQSRAELLLHRSHGLRQCQQVVGVTTTVWQGDI